MPKKLQAIVANCLAHGRQRIVEVATHLPQACLHNLTVLKEVYRTNAEPRSDRPTALQGLPGPNG